MNNKVYVENLPAATSAADLTRLFSAFGNVVDVNLPADHHTLRPLGFAFVTMVTSEGARAAIQGLNGTQMASLKLTVTEVRPPGPRDQSHPLLPILKKNGIIPTVTSQDETAK